MSDETPGAAGEPQPQDEANANPAKVQETLESLLSKKNLVRDQFLARNMNPQMYIPINVLMAHEKMSAIGATEEAVAAAATASTRLGIDDAKTMVRPLLKSKRNVIILRDMPDNTTEEQVKELFASGPHAEKLVSIKAEVNNTWFVKFNLDEGTQDVVLWLRSQQFQGQAVNASIKSEHFLRSFFPLHPPAQNMDPNGGMAPPWVMDPSMGGMGYPMGFGAPQEYLAEGIGPMGFDGMKGMGFDGMKGKGKGDMMMPMMMPEMQMQNGPQPPGSWQPWGMRHQPPPMILPIMVPEASPNKEASEGGNGGKGGEKGKGKGSKGKENSGDSKWGNEKWGNEKWGNEKWGNEAWGNNEKWSGGGGGGWGNSGKGKGSW